MKNYAGLGHLTIGGQERPLYFGIMQARVFCQSNALEFYEYQEKLSTLVDFTDPFLLADLLHSALVAGCKHPEHKKAVDFTQDDVTFWVQEMTSEQWTAVFKLMADSNAPNVEAPIQEPNA